MVSLPSSCLSFLKEWKKPWHHRPGFFFKRCMFHVNSRLRFIEPHLASRSISRQRGNIGFTKSNTMVIAARWCLIADKSVSLPGMDTTGAIDIHPSSAPL